MHEGPSLLSGIGIAIAIVAAIIFAIMAIKNRNMTFGIGKEGPYVKTKKEEPPSPAGDNNISGVNVKARDVQGGIRIGHDNPGKK